MISIIGIDFKNGNAELIIDIGETTMQNKGIGTEAITVILDYAFKELNLHRIYLNVFSFNERALGLYKKIGFVVEGKARESLFRNCSYYDIVQMGILQKEYLNF